MVTKLLLCSLGLLISNIKFHVKIKKILSFRLFFALTITLQHILSKNKCVFFQGRWGCLHFSIIFGESLLCYKSTFLVLDKIVSNVENEDQAGIYSQDNFIDIY